MARNKWLGKLPIIVCKGDDASLSLMRCMMPDNVIMRRSELYFAGVSDLAPKEVVRDLLEISVGDAQLALDVRNVAHLEEWAIATDKSIPVSIRSDNGFHKLNRKPKTVVLYYRGRARLTFKFLTT